MGVCISSNGDRYDGYWNDDKPNGHGRGIYVSGNMYEGDFLNGQRQGKGKSYALYLYSFRSIQLVRWGRVYIEILSMVKGTDKVL